MLKETGDLAEFFLEQKLSWRMITDHHKVNQQYLKQMDKKNTKIKNTLAGNWVNIADVDEFYCSMEP